MKKLFKLILAFMMISTLLAKKEIHNIPRTMEALGIEADSQPANNISNRYESIIYFEDMEGDVSDWTVDAGWQQSGDDYYSPSNSMNSPNDATTDGPDEGYSFWSLMSPEIDIPFVNNGEDMYFKFALFADMPDWDGDSDADGFLDDYYFVSVREINPVFHATTFNSPDGSNNYWAGEASIGGYRNSWMQYLDTPVLTIPAEGAVLSADMYWYIEDWAGAVGAIAGTDVDGWDQALVQVSRDGGEMWSVLEGSDPYDFDCGYGGYWNGLDCLPGWASQGSPVDWHEVTFDLSDYAGDDVIIRFAFLSDPCYATDDTECTGGTYAETGFQVDNIVVSNDVFEDDADGDSQMIASGFGSWNDVFYDYGDATRPGSMEWTIYEPGLAFNGNIMMDLSAYQGKSVRFRFETRFDDDDSNLDLDGTQAETGTGLWIDDFGIYVNTLYPAPTGLMADAMNESALLYWDAVDTLTGATYNLYRDGSEIESGLSDNNFMDSGLMNNMEYSYQVSWVHPDGEESEVSAEVTVIPQAETVSEYSYDDGTSEQDFNLGSQHYTAVKHQNNGRLIRYNWYQTEDGGAFHIKIWDDNNGTPGGELLSRIVNYGVIGWNSYNIEEDDNNLTVDGDYWIGIMEFSSSSPFGFDTSSDNSTNMYKVGPTGTWASLSDQGFIGNLMLRVLVDENPDIQCPPADLNNDGQVNITDIMTVVNSTNFVGNNILTENQICSADLNSDGLINVSDIVSMVNLILYGD